MPAPGPKWGFKGAYPLLVGAVGALAVIGAVRYSKQLRPLFVKAVKDGLKAKDWVSKNLETFKEDVEDAIAEANHEHNKEKESPKVES